MGLASRFGAFLFVLLGGAVATAGAFSLFGQGRASAGDQTVRFPTAVGIYIPKMSATGGLGDIGDDSTDDD